MIVKLFVLGNPGSGKSAMARCIKSFTEDKGQLYKRLHDYWILQEMVGEDSRRCKKERWFRWLDEGDKEKGFDVLNIEAFDRALQELERLANKEFARQELSESETCLVVIEFARNDYRRAFEQFSSEFLQDAYFLYLDTNIEVCKQRIWERSQHRRTEDDYYVSDYILQTYYSQGNGRCLVEILKEYGIRDERIRIYANDVDLQVASGYVGNFVQYIFRCNGE
jgi:hypothetical protein